jgi:hypothetical protein
MYELYASDAHFAIGDTRNTKYDPKKRAYHIDKMSATQNLPKTAYSVFTRKTER